MTYFRTLKGKDKHKMWFIHDNYLILPEYFIEFEYV